MSTRSEVPATVAVRSTPPPAPSFPDDPSATATATATATEPVPDRPATAAPWAGADPRARPEHYEPGRVPPQVHRHAGRPDMLPVGSAGKVGLLELAFERKGRRTELVHHYQRPPLHLTRPMYFDPARPDLAVTFLLSTGGGVVQADRLRTDIHCGPGGALHVTTQAATRVHEMQVDYATHLVALSLGADAYVEYLPEAIIPYADSRYYQRTTVTLDPTATVLLGETVVAGRLARGERHRYEVLIADLEVTDPDGSPLVVDTVRLEPGGVGGVVGPAVLSGHDVMSTLHVLSPLAGAAEVADVLHATLSEQDREPLLRYGVSVLPEERGAWLRVLGDDPQAVRLAMFRAWDAVRRLLIGVPAPDLRKT